MMSMSIKDNYGYLKLCTKCIKTNLSTMATNDKSPALSCKLQRCKYATDNGKLQTISYSPLHENIRTISKFICFDAVGWVSGRASGP